MADQQQPKRRRVAASPAIGRTGGADKIQQRAGGTAKTAIGLGNDQRERQSDPGDGECGNAGGAPDPGVERLDAGEVDTPACQQGQQRKTEQQNGRELQHTRPLYRRRPALR